MTTRISSASDTARKNAAANAVVDLLDAGAGAGYVEIRTGTQPATVDSAATGTLLGTLPLSDPAFGSATGGVATAGAITSDTNADASGTAGWFRAYDSNGTAVIDGSCSGSGGGGDMEFDDPAIVAGGTINISSWTYTQP